MALAASSALSFPIISASLRLVVIWTEVRSTRSHVGRGASATAAYFYNKLDVCHDFLHSPWIWQ